MHSGTAKGCQSELRGEGGMLEACTCGSTGEWNFTSDRYWRALSVPAAGLIIAPPGDARKQNQSPAAEFHPAPAFLSTPRIAQRPPGGDATATARPVRRSRTGRAIESLLGQVLNSRRGGILPSTPRRQDAASTRIRTWRDDEVALRILVNQALIRYVNICILLAGSRCAPTLEGDDGSF